MNFLMVVLISLLLGALGVSLLQHTESFDESVRLFCRLAERQLLIEHVMSYGVAALVEDADLQEAIFRRGTYEREFDSWPQHPYNAFLKVRSVDSGYELTAVLYKEKEQLITRRALLIYNAEKKTLQIMRTMH